jgi:hypothetical protein
MTAGKNDFYFLLYLRLGLSSGLIPAVPPPSFNILNKFVGPSACCIYGSSVVNTRRKGAHYALCYVFLPVFARPRGSGPTSSFVVLYERQWVNYDSYIILGGRCLTVSVPYSSEKNHETVSWSKLRDLAVSMSQSSTFLLVRLQALGWWIVIRIQMQMA